MSAIDWNALAASAAAQTDNEFKNSLAALTNLKVTEIDCFITQSNISNANILKVLDEINNATKSNNEKSKDIIGIENGVSFLVSLASKIV
ncbi:hypothetical protein [Flavobacterium lipolyticum]|uniref:Uncharacterized protein n=1 Tax=Flavobacterium lipolyticum TaxID=2893754 RepID=A0ABS8LVV9_9FLAO|nr:hypothetical protein [Flavobacterium sp. F-126]MCC9016702.1 hypothetical protein [Flavobacterium sp. F-126]